MIWRWIFGVGGALLLLRVAINVWVAPYLARPFSTLVGTVAVVGVALVLAVALLADGRGGRVELRRASTEYGPRRGAGDPPDVVEHHHVLRVEHTHRIEHVYRYEGGRATAPPDWRSPSALPSVPVVDGELVARRAIEGGAG